DNEWGIELV
nr:Chain B, ASP-ASN-GLU-TRP-GLY-ILE-GLU-LEU-VAL [Homo sapiens]